MRYINLIFTILTLFGVSEVFSQKKEKTIETSLFDNFQVRNIGPAKVSGRITKGIKDYSNTSTWYVSTASGNVWKTKNS